MVKRAYIYGQSAPTLEQFKSHIRVTSSDLDAELVSKLRAATLSAEHYIGSIIALSEFTYEGVFSASIRLHTPVCKLEYVEVDGKRITGCKYAKNFLSVPGVGENIKVVYRAGMEQVPEDITAAILLHAAALFNNPVDSVETLPKASTNLLKPYRTWGVNGK